MPMWLWPKIGNDCCLGVESGDNATAVAGACETVGWMVRLLECQLTIIFTQVVRSESKSKLL